MLPYGEYTVVEKGAEIQGFILNATSDPADGKVTVSEKPQTIAFTNTYEMMNPEAGTLIVKRPFRAMARTITRHLRLPWS